VYADKTRRGIRKISVILYSGRRRSDDAVPETRVLLQIGGCRPGRRRAGAEAVGGQLDPSLSRPTDSLHLRKSASFVY